MKVIQFLNYQSVELGRAEVENITIQPLNCILLFPEVLQGYYIYLKHTQIEKKSAGAEKIIR